MAEGRHIHPSAPALHGPLEKGLYLIQSKSGFQLKLSKFYFVK